MKEYKVVKFSNGRYGIKHPTRDWFLDLKAIKGYWWAGISPNVFWWAMDSDWFDSCQCRFEFTINDRLRRLDNQLVTTYQEVKQKEK